MARTFGGVSGHRRKTGSVGLRLVGLRGEGQTFFRAFINSELGPPLVALTQN